MQGVDAALHVVTPPNQKIPTNGGLGSVSKCFERYTPLQKKVRFIHETEGEFYFFIPYNLYGNTRTIRQIRQESRIEVTIV